MNLEYARIFARRRRDVAARVTVTLADGAALVVECPDGASEAVVDEAVRRQCDALVARPEVI